MTLIAPSYFLVFCNTQNSLRERRGGPENFKFRDILEIFDLRGYFDYTPP